MPLNQGASAARSYEEHWDEEAPTGCKQRLLPEGASMDAAKACEAFLLCFFFYLCDIFKLKEQNDSMLTIRVCTIGSN